MEAKQQEESVLQKAGDHPPGRGDSTCYHLDLCTSSVNASVFFLSVLT